MFNPENYTMEIAKKLYQLSCDQDFSDYNETREKEVAEIEQCLYYLHTVCCNDLNSDYFRTFYNCLDRITSIN